MVLGLPAPRLTWLGLAVEISVYWAMGEWCCFPNNSLNGIIIYECVCMQCMVCLCMVGNDYCECHCTILDLIPIPWIDTGHQDRWKMVTMFGLVGSILFSMPCQTRIYLFIIHTPIRPFLCHFQYLIKFGFLLFFGPAAS